MAARPKQLPKLLRILRSHDKLFASMVLTLLVAVVLPWDWRWSTRLLGGWDVGAGCYLVLAFVVVRRFDLKRVQMRAEQEDEGAFVLLILTVLAAVASLAAVVMELGTAAGSDRRPLFLLAATTIALSWALIHVVFMFHYAHLFYRGSGDRGRCLVFPGDDKPNYWDFVYFSFVIGMTFQVSDVQVRGKDARRLVVAHGALSFWFNVAVLALAVNIAASLI